MKRKITISLAIVLSAVALFGCGGGDSSDSGNESSGTVSQEEYDALKTSYNELAAYADSLEEKVRYLEAVNSAYDTQINQYIKEEEAGNKVIIVEPMVEGSEE